MKYLRHFDSKSDMDDFINKTAKYQTAIIASDGVNCNSKMLYYKANGAGNISPNPLYTPGTTTYTFEKDPEVVVDTTKYTYKGLVSVLNTKTSELMSLYVYEPSGSSSSYAMGLNNQIQDGDEGGYLPGYGPLTASTSSTYEYECDGDATTFALTDITTSGAHIREFNTYTTSTGIGFIDPKLATTYIYSLSATYNTSLIELEFPSTMHELYDGAFKGCTSLTHIIYKGCSYTHKSDIIKALGFGTVNAFEDTGLLD